MTCLRISAIPCNESVSLPEIPHLPAAWQLRMVYKGTVLYSAAHKKKKLYSPP